jgi:hypothetical protein
VRYELGFYIPEDGILQSCVCEGITNKEDIPHDSEVLLEDPDEM